MIGVEDSGAVCGLEPDFMAMELKAGDVDRWLQRVRDKIDTSFFQGRMINDHVDVKFFAVDDKHVARAVIRPRRKFALLRDGGQNQYAIIQRQGNRTVKIDMTDAEEFFENRFRQRQGIGG